MSNTHVSVAQAGLLLAARLEVLVERGGEREEDDDDDDPLDVLFELDAEGALDERAEEVAGEDHAEDPGEAADHVVGDELPVGHLRRARHDGREGADDGDEARDDDRLAAVLLVKLMRLFEVARAEDERLL